MNTHAEQEAVKYAQSILPGGYIGVSVKTNRLVIVSDGFTSLTGYTIKDLQGFKEKWAKVIFHPQDEEKFDKDMKRGFAASLKAYSETRIMCSSGSTIWADVYAGIVDNENNEKYVYFNFIDNTKRRREIIGAENTRREMDAIIKNIPGGVAKVMIDKDFRIVFASEGFYRLSQYSKDEFHGVPVLGRGAYIIHPEDIHRVRAQVDEQLKNNQQLFAEFRIRKKDGHTAWLEAHGTLVENHNGLLQAQVIFTDTTAAKRNARRLLRLTNSVPGGVAHLSLAGDNINVEFASDGFYRILGYTKEEFNDLGLEQNCAPLFSPQDWQAMRNIIKRFFASKRTDGELECRIKDSSGEVRWVNVKGSRRDDDKQQNTLECVLTDVTIMHKSLDRLRQSEERYRFISEQMNEVIVEWDLASGDIYHSNAFERRFGYKLPEQNTYSFLLKGDLIYTDDVPSFKKAMEDILSGCKYSEAEYRIKDISGTYQWCGIHLTNVFDEDGRPFKSVGIIMDMANLKKNAAKLEEKMQLDPMTKAYNPVATREHVTESLRRRKPEHASAMFAVDVDNFKNVNDSYGHLMGDEVLVQMTQRLRSLIRAGDILGRVGGDEFVVFIPNDMPKQGAQQKAKSFLKVMSKPVAFKDVECMVHISVGIALCPQSGDSYDELYEKADKALYNAKESGRNQFAVYEE